MVKIMAIFFITTYSDGVGQNAGLILVPPMAVHSTHFLLTQMSGESLGLRSNEYASAGESGVIIPDNVTGGGTFPPGSAGGMKRSEMYILFSETLDASIYP